MTRRVVKTHELHFLKQELQYLEKSGVLPTEKVNEIQEHYEVRDRLSENTIVCRFDIDRCWNS